MLKPGGRFLCLEFSEVDMPLLDRVYEAGRSTPFRRSARSSPATPSPIAYLVESIRKFPNQANFADMIRSAGFDAGYAGAIITGGIAALHSGWKL